MGCPHPRLILHPSKAGPLWNLEGPVLSRAELTAKRVYVAPALIHSAIRFIPSAGSSGLAKGIPAVPAGYPLKTKACRRWVAVPCETIAAPLSLSRSARLRVYRSSPDRLVAPFGTPAFAEKRGPDMLRNKVTPVFGLRPHKGSVNSSPFADLIG